MIVRVLLFARAKDLAGKDFLEMDMPDECCVGDLRQRLLHDIPALDSLLVRSAIAVEGECVDDSRMLFPLAAVALLPPVSGG